MFRLINSHLQAYSLQVKSQNAVHTLRSQCVYISEIFKPYHLPRRVKLAKYIANWLKYKKMRWFKYFTDANILVSQCVHTIL